MHLFINILYIFIIFNLKKILYFFILNLIKVTFSMLFIFLIHLFRQRAFSFVGFLFIGLKTEEKCLKLNIVESILLWGECPYYS